MEKLFKKPSMGESMNTLGMFDFIKGFMLFTIIWDHTYSSFERTLFAELPGIPATIFDVLKGTVGLGNVTIPLFVLISGYGFRPGKIGKVLKNQFEMLIKPYIIVAILASAAHLLIHYCFFKSFRGAVEATISIAGGFLLGLADSQSYGGYSFFSIGAVWFLLNLFIAWNILNLIFKYFSEKVRIFICVLSAATGALLWIFVKPPYSIDRALASVLFLYLGYLLKKYDVLSMKFSTGYILLAVVSCLVAIYSYIWGQQSGNMIATALGVFMFPQVLVIMYGVIRLNRFDFPFREMFARVGRYSLWLMCAEAFTMNVFPWYLIYQSGEINTYIAFFIILVCKIVIIYCIYIGLRFIEKKKHQKKKALRQARRNSVVKEGE